jgi:hypothetical protein
MKSSGNSEKMEMPSQLQLLLDRAVITDTIVGAANAFDTQDWAQLRACLTDDLHTDYSDSRGEAPATVSADSLRRGEAQWTSWPEDAAHQHQSSDRDRR